jgi:hypothetical protein
MANPKSVADETIEDQSTGLVEPTNTSDPAGTDRPADSETVDAGGEGLAVLALIGVSGLGIVAYEVVKLAASPELAFGVALIVASVAFYAIRLSVARGVLR